MEEDMSINITELWHKQLFVSLMKIQEYERMATDGVSAIESVFEININDVPQIQFQYIRLITTEMDILLVNTKKKIDKAFYEKSRKEIESAEELLNKHQDKVLRKRYDQVANRSKYEVTELYYKILDSLKKIREKLVEELSDILYGTKDEDIGKKKW